ncbi:hypothetical protein C2U72_12170, partial [Prosthecomicrobium hirschii]|uniref:aminotransferase class I/II-fold pyridoxal phosphate-dependent enzyme n=1 Tax=Prosthecodimorpha hirschii TaxID=665126 RepID=UPI00112BE56C
MNANTLKLEGVAKTFGVVRVLEAIDLDIRQGERHALIGPNGAGKSTLFNLISGAFAPTSGLIALNGTSIGGLVPHALNRAGLGRSFQITHVFDRLTVRENILLAVMGRFGKRWSLMRIGPVWAQIAEETDRLIAGANLAAQAGKRAADLAYSEIYFDNDPPPSILQVPGATEVAVEFTSMSKSFSMPGWRIGFAVGNERLIAA